MKSKAPPFFLFVAQMEEVCGSKICLSLPKAPTPKNRINLMNHICKIQGYKLSCPLLGSNSHNQDDFTFFLIFTGFPFATTFERGNTPSYTVSACLNFSANSVGGFM